jgi:hypothetical protein
MPEPLTLSGMIAAVTPPGIVPAGVPVIEGAWQVRIVTGDIERDLLLSGDAIARQRRLLQMQKFGRPVFLQIEDRWIVDVRVPQMGRVIMLEREPDPDGWVRFALDSSPQRFRVQAELMTRRARALLEASMKFGGVVMVDATGRGAVLHVAEAPFEAWPLAPLPGPEGAQSLGSIAMTRVSRSKVGPLFHQLANASCQLTAIDGCIPFDYPNTGCNARAHKMCELLQAQSVSCAKVWVFDPLMSADTKNFQDACQIGWLYHVAPYVRVSGAGNASVRVLDPSLFTHAVTLAQFVAGLHTLVSKVQFSQAKFYQMGSTGGSLPSPNQCDSDLEWLREEAAARIPQPPYPC